MAEEVELPHDVRQVLFEGVEHDCELSLVLFEVENQLEERGDQEVLPAAEEVLESDESGVGLVLRDFKLRS